MIMLIHKQARWFLFFAMMLFAAPVLAMGGSIFNFGGLSMEETYQSDQLFKPYGNSIYRLAQKIERKQPITLEEVKATVEDINARYGKEITLLFHAASSYNLQAVDIILEAGADTTMPSRLPNDYDFTYILGMPGGDEGSPGDINFVNGLIKLYLKHGGDPNIRKAEEGKDPIITAVAASRNMEGMRMLLAAGADFWAIDKMGMTAASIIAQRPSSDLLFEFIDAGYFDHPPEGALKEFFSALSAYTQRGDKRSLQNQKVGRRVLKRNPFYEEDAYTERLFQGPIPWKQILNEVR